MPTAQRADRLSVTVSRLDVAEALGEKRAPEVVVSPAAEVVVQVSNTIAVLGRSARWMTSRAPARSGTPENPELESTQVDSQSGEAVPD